MAVFYNLFTEDLNFDACSGDELDGKSYYIKTFEWRAEPVRDFMETIDNLHVATRKKRGPFGDTGNYPVERKEPTEKIFDKRTAPPRGLPRNFYHEGWLEELDDYEIEALEMKEEIDLTIPKSMQE